MIGSDESQAVLLQYDEVQYRGSEATPPTKGMSDRREKNGSEGIMFPNTSTEHVWCQLYR